MAMNVPKLSSKHYLQRVAQVAGLEAAQRLERFLPTQADLERIGELLEAFGEHPPGYPGLVKLYDLSHAQAALAQPPAGLLNWHYDRTTQVLLVNLRRGVHEALSAALLATYQPTLATGDVAVDAERFLKQGLGWFRSTASRGRALKGEGIALNPQERRAFESQSFFD